jgi:hypothetical protein
MRPQKYSTDSLKDFLKEKKYATLVELKATLGTGVSMTVFRKLRELGYITSCSHRGKYYSLKSVAQFDESGLWRPNGILFSRFGTLLDTVESFVKQSDSGYTARELRQALSIEVKEQLMQLWVETRLNREDIDGTFVYVSSDVTRKERQLAARRQKASQQTCSSLIQPEIQAAIILFYSMLNEKQRRIFAGLESIKHGHGGDAIIARLLDVDVHTVAKGRKQLLDSDVEIDRIRRAGAGRHAIKKNS